MSVLAGDVKKCMQEFHAEDNQFWRRTFIRSTFALIEGNTFQMKQYALTQSHLFTRAEVTLLREESYELNEKGIAFEQPKYVNISRNIKFAFQSFAHSFESDYILKVNDKGWDCFKKALKVRDRLTHPKGLNDLNITDQEINDALISLSWYSKSFEELFEITRSVVENEILRREQQEPIDKD
jgi:hypothetical protein